MTRGVLPKQTLRQLLGQYIRGIPEKYLNPASIDLPLSEEAYRCNTTFTVLQSERVRDLFPLIGARKHHFSTPLEVKVPYLFRVEGQWQLPKNVYGYANPKSSTGRNGFFCRVVADHVEMYDAAIQSGWGGEMWILARADFYPVLVEPGLAVSQMRLFDGPNFLDELQTEMQMEKTGLLFHPDGRKIPYENARHHGGAFMLTLEVGSRMGWECQGVGCLLDLSKLNHYKPADFFRPIKPANGRYVLRKGTFYILTTRERVMVPPSLSAELRAIDPRLGEFRSHAAGYIDPGWGYGKNGESKGRPITLEVIPQEDMLVRDGQPIARLRYEHMKEVPETVYDDALSNYTDQKGARLSKHFIRD